MKTFSQIIIIILIIVFVLVLDIITNNMTEKYIKKIESEMANIERVIDEKTEKLKEQTNNLDKMWKDIENKMSYYSEHNELEKVSLNIKLLKKQIEIEEYNLAKESISEINYILEHIEEKQKLKIKNIF